MKNSSHRLIILLLTLTVLSTSYAYYGAKYEPPDGKTYHGVGWHNPSQIEYGEMFPDSMQPVLHQMMSPLPGDVRRRGGMTVSGLLRGLAPDHFDNERQFAEISLHFTDNSSMFDTTFALTRELDGYIDTLAIAFREHDKPIFLRIGLEMNGAWNGYTPWVFPLAFRKLVLGLRERGVENFASVWCYEPDALDDFADSTRRGWKWYPGDDVVDWFGLDPFDADHFDPDEPDSVEARNGWTISKKGKSEKFLAFARERGKPVYLNELSARHVWITPIDDEIDSTSGEVDWEYWFAPFFEFLGNHPEIKAFNYINLNWTNYEHWEHWGDARLQINEYIRDHWVEAISDERYLHAGFDIANLKVEEKPAPTVPSDFTLSIYPNPFNSSFRAEYNLTGRGLISLKLYDIAGRAVWSSRRELQPAGRHAVLIDGSGFASGIYMMSLKSGGLIETRKVVLIR